MGKTKFEERVRAGLATLLVDEKATVVVDHVEAMGNDAGSRALSVSFHLEGAWSSPARFTFPFAEAIPLEESLADLRDLISRSWRTAHLPPPNNDLHTALP